MTLCNPMDCTLPGYSVHGISQTRILEWVAIAFFRGSSWPRDQIYVSCTGSGFFIPEPPGKPLTFWQLFSPSPLFLLRNINEVKISSSSLLPCGIAKDQAPIGHRFKNLVENLSKCKSPHATATFLHWKLKIEVGRFNQTRKITIYLGCCSLLLVTCLS